jgi:tetratricopeptide (TPR) repeat protein
MTSRLFLPTLAIVCALAAGCFPARIRVGRLGPDRILTDEEIRQVDQKIAEADKAWTLRADPANIEKAMGLLRESLQLAPHNTQALWRAARICYWRADHAGQAKDVKKQFAEAEEGITYAKHAIFVDTHSAEGYYYLALSYAMRADASKATGLSLVKPMLDALKRADDLDDELDYGGARRVMGQIYMSAPSWPTSVGDLDQAIELLEDAVEDFEDHPENHLVLAEAYKKARRYAAAREHLEIVLAAKPAPDWAPDLPEWQEHARKLLKELPQK